MNLFNLIRFPVSMPPSLQQLESLPEDLYLSWIKHPECNWREVDDESRLDRFWVYEWMIGNREPHTARMILEMESDIFLLRKLIQEYGE